MSHFCVIVTGDKVDKQLAPFHETSSGKFAEFIDETEPVLEAWGGTFKGMYAHIQDNGKPAGDSHAYRKAARKGLSPMFHFELDGIKAEECVDIPYSERYATIEEFASDYYGYKAIGSGLFGRYANPNAKWDWNEVGGRWTGFLQLKKGATGTSGSPGLCTPRNDDPSRADRALRSDVDFKKMVRKKRAAAKRRYDGIAKLYGGKIMKLEKTREEISEEMNNGRSGDEPISLDDTHTAYWTQPTLLKLESLREDMAQKKIPENGLLLWGFDIGVLTMGREEYIESCGIKAVSSYAILHKGNWLSRGDMGYWGMSSNEDDTWEEKAYEFLTNLPDDTLLTIVDCHI